MGLLTFHGGIHPSDRKELTKEKPIVPLVPVRPLVYPLSQHIGAPAIAVVKKGEHVSKGQLIASADGFLSANIHSSISGTVTAIAPHLTPQGTYCESIVIEKDNETDNTDTFEPDNLENLTPEEIIKRIQNAGITGMGGAGFPTHVKLSPKEPDKIDYIIANCAECEPYLTSDYRLILEEAEEIIEGMRIILKLFHNARGILAIEDNKIEVVLHLEKLLKGDRNIEIKVLKTKYPQGSERQLIYACTKRAIHSGMLPADAGCIVQNAATIYAIGQSVLTQIPLMTRVVTVTGNAIHNPCNLLVPLGTSYLDLIDAAGGLKTEPDTLISGGPMMGTSIFDADVPVVKTSSALLCLTTEEAAYYEPSACINCGKCAEVCPERLIPSRLARFAEKGAVAEFIRWNGSECFECGCCSYICPAKRHLTQSIRTMRRQVAAHKKEKIRPKSSE